MTSKPRAGWRVLATVFMIGALFHASSQAKPTVEGFDLVSSTRVDRTKFDYTFSLRVRSDIYSYTSANIIVTSSSAASVVKKNSVNVGPMDVGTLVRTADTFTVRQDRTTQFDPSILHFAVSATLASPQGIGPQIGSVVFLEPSGRPGHDGYLPTQADTPAVGTTPVLRVSISGSVTSAQYSLLALSGQTILTGELLLQDGPLPWYGAAFAIPAQDFKLNVKAVGANGVATTWTSSKTFSPPPFVLKVKPATALLQKGQTTNVSITVQSLSATGSYVVTLLVPAGFQASSTSSTVFLSPGATTTFEAAITAPTTGNAFQRYSITAAISPSNSPQAITTSNQTVMVD